MKKTNQILIVAMIAIGFASCGGNENKENSEKGDKKPSSMITDANSNATGKAIYTKTCQACHQENGEGVPKAFPPLAKADLLNADVNGAIEGVLKGRKGEITVNGEKYNGEMTPQNLNDQEIADVLTYVYSMWENNKTIVTPEMVAQIRKK